MALAVATEVPKAAIASEAMSPDILIFEAILVGSVSVDVME